MIFWMSAIEQIKDSFQRLFDAVKSLEYDIMDIKPFNLTRKILNSKKLWRKSSSDLEPLLALPLMTAKQSTAIFSWWTPLKASVWLTDNPRWSGGWRWIKLFSSSPMEKIWRWYSVIGHGIGGNDIPAKWHASLKGSPWSKQQQKVVTQSYSHSNRLMALRSKYLYTPRSMGNSYAEYPPPHWLKYCSYICRNQYVHMGT